jgi:hypothetical protein
MREHGNWKVKVGTSLLALVAAVLMTAQTAGAAKAPSGKTYFVVSLGVATDESEAYEVSAGCVRFDRSEICEMDGDCGSWWRIEEGRKANKQWAVGFEFDLIDEETGLPVKIEGTGRVDSRGPRSSIAGAAHGMEPASGVRINFALAGRAVGQMRCEQLVAEFEAARQ